MGDDRVAAVDGHDDLLESALVRLVSAGRLTPEQADAVRVEYAAAVPRAGSPWTAVLPEVGGYVGGAFVLAAAIVLAGPRWDDLGRAGQLAILGVPSLLLLGAALTLALTAPGGWSVHARADIAGRRRVVAVLLVVAGALAVGMTAVIADPDSADRAVTTAAAFLAVTGYLFCRTPLLHVMALVFLAAAAATWLIWAFRPGPGSADGVDEFTGPVVAIGIAFVVLAIGWAILADRQILDERALGLTAAGVLGFVGAELLATATGRAGVTGAGYLLLAAVAAAGLVGYIRTRYLGVLAVGVLALATVIPQAVIDYTDGALGAGGALLLIGLSIVGASVVGWRLRTGVHRSARRPDPDESLGPTTQPSGRPPR